MQYASELPRVPVEWHEIWVSTKCGESDTTSGLASNPTVGRVFERLEKLGNTMIFGETTEVTGAEDKIMEQCATPEIAAQFKAAFDNYQELVQSQGVSSLGSQPTEGNIRGGLSTIEEKAFGNIAKMGRCTVVGYLDQAEEPTGAGLFYMDFSQCSGGNGYLVRGRRGSFAPVHHGPGQYHRQPDPPGSQDVGQPLDGRDDD